MPVDVGLLRDVRRKRHDLAVPGRPPGARGRRAADRRDARAGGGKVPDDRLADALGAAGDDGDAAGEIEQVLRGRQCAHWAILALRYGGQTVACRDSFPQGSCRVRTGEVGPRRYFRSWRLITTRWIWLVPSQIWYTRTSR